MNVLAFLTLDLLMYSVCNCNFVNTTERSFTSDSSV